MAWTTIALVASSRVWKRPAWQERNCAARALVQFPFQPFQEGFVMRIPSAGNFYAAALCAIAGCGLSLPVLAGDGPDCQQKMTRLDVEGNGDGQITAAEHAAGADKRFEMMDANKDGKITAAEIDASHGAESAAWANHRMSSADKIKKLDSNNDAALTRDEYADGSQKMFKKLDVDGDGNLTAAEMRPNHQSRMSAQDTE
jgi:EF hand